MHYIQRPWALALPASGQTPAPGPLQPCSLLWQDPANTSRLAPAVGPSRLWPWPPVVNFISGRLWVCQSGPRMQPHPPAGWHELQKEPLKPYNQKPQTQLHHQWAGPNPGTHWALALPTIRPTPALKYLGLLSQLPWDPTPLPMGQYPLWDILEPQPAESETSFNHQANLGNCNPTTHSRTWLAHQWASTSHRTLCGSAVRHIVTWSHQPVASKLHTEQDLAINWTRGQPHLPGHPE